jgi:hypothetical protein
MARNDKVDLSYLDTTLNKNIATKIQNDLDSAYRNTYYSDNKDAKFIDSIRRTIDKDLNGLIDRTRLRYNGHNISDLYSRTLANNDDDMIKEFKMALIDESALADMMDM